jgi:hypothetical protein
MLRAARLLAAVVVLPAAAAHLSAQRAPTDSALLRVPVGSEVRVLPLLSDRWATGRLMRADGDSVMVYRRPQGLLVVPTWQVTRLQRAAGRDHAGGALRGLGLGLLACVPLVAVLGAEGGGNDPSGAALVAGAALIALPTAGFIMGAIRGKPHWREVPVPGARPRADSAAAPART